jgi:hypothetical protein
MAEVQRLEQIINLIVGKPLTWMLYAIWLVTRFCFRSALRFGQWLRGRVVRRTRTRSASRKVVLGTPTVR